MLQPSVIDCLKSIWADPWWRWHSIMSAIFCLALLTVSYASLRLLRRLPDFKHKDEMMWGARWWILIFFGIGLSSAVTWYATTTITLIERFSLLTVYVPWVAFLIALFYGIGSWSMRGPGAILVYWQLSRGKQPVQLEDLLKKWEDRVVHQRRFKKLLLFILGVPLAIVLLAHLIFALR